MEEAKGKGKALATDASREDVMHEDDDDDDDDSSDEENEHEEVSAPSTRACQRPDLLTFMTARTWYVSNLSCQRASSECPFLC